MTRLKNLVKRFSYRELLTECNEQGWEIPSAKEIEESDIKLQYESVWVNDISPDIEDLGTHGYIYYPKSKNKVLVNYMNICNVIVKIELNICKNCKFNVHEFCNKHEGLEMLPKIMPKDFSCSYHKKVFTSGTS